MRVLHVTSEFYPLVKTGGLGDVAAALPAALRARDIDARVLLPGYPTVLEGLEGRRAEHALPDLFGHAARLIAARRGDVPVYALDVPGLFDRPGNPYLDPYGKDWSDNDLRFAALGRAAHWMARRSGAAWRPDVVHAHDWQAGLALAYIALDPDLDGRRPCSVFTIHNIAYQGLFPAERLEVLGLPPHALAVEGLEYWGQIGFLKAGLYYADRITTVSPTYANEIVETEQGSGLQGLLAARRGDLTGILNGIDTDVWNPGTDRHLPRTYGIDDAPDARAANKAELQRRFNLALDPGAPVFAVVSRLNRIKGIDLVLSTLEPIVQNGAQLVVLGTGDGDLENELVAVTHGNPGRVAALIGYDESKSHLIYAGADALLMPSRMEPCGLTQLYAMRYGALPVVRHTGGLADTVTDVTERTLADGTATGFAFDEANPAGLAAAVGRALALWRQAPERWRDVQRTGMSRDFSWDASAADYQSLYEGLSAEAGGRRTGRRRASA